MSDRNSECADCLCRTCKCEEYSAEVGSLPWAVEQGLTLDVEFPEVDVVDEDWLSGVSCNPDAPEECESCQ